MASNELQIKWDMVEKKTEELKCFFKILPTKLKPAAFTYIVLNTIHEASDRDLYTAKGLIQDIQDQLARSIDERTSTSSDEFREALGGEFREMLGDTENDVT